ncbi:glycosyltransferase family 90 protein [Zasmidium cellare ATCC 36951]|uniref:Glycosyltransferase family 90 protein n=1 Tax=Zasmidium cellare ATCC 36951 TaxID=1080233 RepID=A0A6A6CM58_ZASCE|nr:glycosyltransferase family 90 protein [Zasmidium cellare ATCC 36951]KAF2168235.1 glycosyltransferase family 90 protein [Zasmidium cellare ATCC 36951]
MPRARGITRKLSRNIPTTSIAVLLLLLLSINVSVLWTFDSRSVLFAEWLPFITGDNEQQIGRHVWRKAKEPVPLVEVDERHPIRDLMRAADVEFDRYNANRSRTFKEAVSTYRQSYGRHPPPGYKEVWIQSGRWYKFARKRKVHNIDDFQQIHDDLRPFWAIPPSEIRHYAAHASDDYGHLIATISLRDGQIIQELWGWRSETFVKLLQRFARWLPDMDIPMNRMDQPRVIVPWEDMQKHLEVERKGPSLGEEGVADSFSKGKNGLYVPSPHYPEPVWLNRFNPFLYPIEHNRDQGGLPAAYEWFNYAGGQFMDLAAKACPPNSYARNADTQKHAKEAEKSYKHILGGFVTNFNASTDLCTVGPQISHLHGMLYASTSMQVTHKLIPIFSECKTNVNSDILFPANMYWKKDKRYDYNDLHDIDWDDKDDIMVWRGVTSGGNTFADDPQRWKSMHRHRLVLMTNSTELSIHQNTTSILALKDPKLGMYTPNTFTPSAFARNHTNTGFTEKLACVGSCDFYNSSLTMLPQTTFADTFKSKYLIDVDGHSFSGRWRAFLQSRSLGLKATIFREWHDSRLFAWRHFVPVDNRYGELYSLLTYFIGLKGGDVKVPAHDYEAMKLAQQGREWAGKVLRREDIEIYTFRLLLEYGRVVDEERERIGVVGDGGVEMEEFDRRYPAVD